MSALECATVSRRLGAVDGEIADMGLEMSVDSIHASKKIWPNFSLSSTPMLLPSRLCLGLSKRFDTACSTPLVSLMVNALR